MPPADEQFGEWFTNRQTETKAWHTLLNTPAGQLVSNQVYTGVTGAGKTHLRKRFENLARIADVPFVTVELDPGKGGTFDEAVLAYRLVVAIGIDAPRTTLALLRIASMESGNPVIENNMANELGTAGFAAAFDAILSNLSSLSIGGVAAALFRQQYTNLQRSKQGLQQFLRTDEGDSLRNEILAQTESGSIRRKIYRRLAADVSAANPRPDREVKAVVFVDSGEHQEARKPWLDRLLGDTDGIVAAVFGQTGVASDLPEALWQKYSVDGFLRDDAVAYCVEKRGVSAATTEEDILPGAREEGDPERYHVYSLGLLCDAARGGLGPLAIQDQDRHLSRPEALTRRFLARLTEVDKGFLRRLALVPTFDEDAACHACATGSDGETRRAKMEWLRKFTFVQPAGEGLWRLHAVMRRVLAETSQQVDNQRRHGEWRDYWTERSEAPTDDAAARAWHHRFALGLAAAMREWYAAAEEALRTMDTARHAFLVDVARPFIAADLAGGARATPEERAAAWNNWAVESQQATLGNTRARLEEAVAAYRAALEVRTREAAPAQWATTQNNLGIALGTLGKREQGTERLEEAVAAYRAALEVRTRAAAPAGWATTQNNLGNALCALGGRGEGTERLEEAVAAYRAALEVFTREAAPADWATTQNNLGNALCALGGRGEGTERLEEAVAAYRAALQVRTRAAAPVDWAMSQNNLGNALQSLGEREQGTERLEEAVAACRAALEVRTRAAAPVDWAMSQNNLGNALQSLGGREQGTERLKEAVDAYRAALEVFTRAAAPAQWATTQNNLGSALRSLGEREQGTKRLEEAVAAYRAALEVFTRAQTQHFHDQTSRNLAHALHLLKGRRGTEGG